MLLKTRQRIAANDVPGGYLLGYVSMAVLLLLLHLAPALRVHSSALSDVKVFRSIHAIHWPYYPAGLGRLLDDFHQYAVYGPNMVTPAYSQALITLSILLTLVMGVIFFAGSCRRLLVGIRSPLIRPSTLYGSIVIGVWAVMSVPIAVSQFTNVIAKSDYRVSYARYRDLQGDMFRVLYDVRQYVALPVTEGGGGGSFDGYELKSVLYHPSRTLVQLVPIGDTLRIGAIGIDPAGNSTGDSLFVTITPWDLDYGDPHAKTEWRTLREFDRIVYSNETFGALYE